MDVPALERAFHRLRGNAAVGVDGVSKAEYEQGLEGNLEDLHGRLRTKRYRHQPLRRVHIPKGGGRTRPIGISAVEDKVVQGGATRGAGGGVRAGFSGVLVRLSGLDAVPTMRFVRWTERCTRAR